MLLRRPLPPLGEHSGYQNREIRVSQNLPSIFSIVFVVIRANLESSASHYIRDYLSRWSNLQVWPRGLHEYEPVGKSLMDI